VSYLHAKAVRLPDSSTELALLYEDTQGISGTTSRGSISTGVNSLCTIGIDTGIDSKVFKLNPYNNNEDDSLSPVPRDTIHPHAKAVGLSLPLDPTNVREGTHLRSFLCPLLHNPS
jgi:hypothetical protein